MKYADIVNLLEEVLTHGSREHKNLHMLDTPSAWMATQRANAPVTAIQRVESALESVSDLQHIIGKGFNAPAYRYAYNALDLAIWLMNRSLIVGPPSAVAEMERFAGAPSCIVSEYLAFSGVVGPTPARLTDGIEILPMSAIPETERSIEASDPKWERFRRTAEGGVERRMSSAFYDGGDRFLVSNHDANAATAVLRRQHRVKLQWTDTDPEKGFNESMGEMLAVLELIPLKTLAPVFPVMYWHDVEDYTPKTSGWIYRHWSYSTQQSFPAARLEQDLRNISALAEMFDNLQSSTKRSLRVPIERFNRALSAYGINRAIELGIALEALLLDEKEMSEQISLTFRLRGAWLLGTDLQSRRRFLDVFKALYKCRSTAVHKGRLSDGQLSILDERIKPIEFLSDDGEALRLAAWTIAEVIERGGSVDWTLLTLGSSMES